MKLEQIILLLSNAVDDGTKNVLSNSGINQNKLSKSEAYRIYGRSNVDRWLRENLILISDKHLNRSKLEAVAASSNRDTYLPVAER
jgi:hypothetical protein